MKILKSYQNVLYMTYQNFPFVKWPELSIELLILQTPLWKVHCNGRYDELKMHWRPDI